MNYKFTRIKRALAAFLAILMLLSSDSFTDMATIIANASTGENLYSSEEIPTQDTDEEEFILYMNGVPTDFGSMPNWETVPSVDYGQPMIFEARSNEHTDTITVFYATSIKYLNDGSNDVDIDLEKVITESTVLPVGNYYLFYQGELSASIGEGGVIHYAIKVNPATISNPANLKWNDSVGHAYAMWDAPTEDTNGRAIDAAELEYILELYYEDEETPIYTSSAITETSLDLYSQITKSSEEGGKGYGSYSFKVTASEKTTGVSNYSKSEKVASGSYRYTDTVVPVIEEYVVDTDESGAKVLKGTASDDGTGVAGYAFADSTVPEAEIEWTSLNATENRGTDVTVYASLEQAGIGTIYFYVKDGDNNISKQLLTTNTSESVVISSVILNSYYSANTEITLTKYLEGSESIVLPTSGDMARTGYVFEGWFDNSEKTGDAIDSLTAGASGFSMGTSKNVYAKWSKQNIAAPSLENITKVYDGEVSELTVTLPSSITYDSISWKWYYRAIGEDEAVELTSAASQGSRNSSVSVKNVSDSGEYYAVATISVAGEEDEIVTSSVSSVTITKRILNVIIDNKETVYLSEAPEFTFSEGDNSEENHGLVGTDSTDAILDSYKAYLEADYSAGDDARDYAITYSGDGIAADNYDVVIVENGVLTVNPYDLSEETGLTVEISQSEYIYDGTEKTPGVSSASFVHETGTYELVEGTDKDYTISYRDNVSAGLDTTAVKLSFKGNYTGTVYVPFTIIKGTYVANAHINGWKYGEYDEETNAPSIDTNKNGGAPVTFYYLKTTDTESSDEELLASFADIDKTAKVNVRPEKAGRYFVWAVIGATDDFNEITTNPDVFTITKRSITLTAVSASKPYDGNVLASAKYVQTGDGFVEEEGFLYVSVDGSITNIGTVENVITYKLTTATDADCYDITVVNGLLEVTESVLVSPSSFAWNESKPGSLSWVALTRDHLELKYVIKLYRVLLDESGNAKKDGEGNILYDPEPVAVKETHDTSISFIDEILEDSALSPTGYSATLQVVPVYGEGEAHNYVESVEGAKTAPKYTAKVNIGIQAEDVGVDRVSIRKSTEPDADYEDATTEPVIIFQGQSVNGVMWTKGGYRMNSDPWLYENNEASEDSFDYLNPGPITWSYGENNFYTKVYTVRSKFTFTDRQLDGPKEITILGKSSDDYPYILHLEKHQTADYKAIKVNAEFGDANGLLKYALIKADSLGNYHTEDWTEIPLGEDGNPKNTYSIELDVKEPGKYRLYVCDTNDNITHSSEAFDVYAVYFSGGTSTVENPVTGSMDPLFKLEGGSIPLPENEFERAGFGFTNWTGSTGIYSHEGLYVANANDTLVAGWTDRKITYTVRYFYEQLTESVDEETGLPVVSAEFVEEEPVEYTSAYGSRINYDYSAIKAGRKGYTLTNEPEGVDDYEDHIIADADGKELNLYYALNKWDIVYTYKDIKNIPQTITKTYYFGQTVTEIAKPHEVGYTFVGWNWDEAGQAPAKMPNNSLNVSGSFVPEQTKYYIVYYEQNLDQSVSNASNNYLAKSFGINEEMTEEITANYAENLIAVLSAPPSVPAGSTAVIARDIIGFTPAAVKVYYGAPKTTSDDDQFTALIDGSNRSDYGTVKKELSSSEESELEAEGNDPKDYEGPTYICFYYTRNLYDITLDVYKDARESQKHLFGSYYDGTAKTDPNGNEVTDNDNARWTLPYGYVFEAESSELIGDGTDGSYKASYFETYGYYSEGVETIGPSDYSTAWTKRWPTAETSKMKYYLANFIDWSTGSTRPATMPAGDAAITREYASAEKARYVIDVYAETLSKETTPVVINGVSTDVTVSTARGTYDKAMSYERYGDVGSTVKLVSSIPEEKEANTVYVQFDEVIKGITNYEYYEHNPENDLCNTVDNPNHEVLTEVITENVVEDGIITNVVHLRVNFVRKTYTTKINYYKYDSEGTKLFATTSVNQKWETTFFVDPLCYFDGNTEAPVYEDGKVATVIDPEAIKDTFRNNDYVVSYEYYRYYVPGRTGTSGTGQYNTVSGDLGTDVYQTAIRNAAAQRYYVGGNNSGYVNVCYSEQEIFKHYYVALGYEIKDTGSYKRMMIPIHNDDVSGEFQMCAANKCDVYMTTENGIEIPEDYIEYPGSYFIDKSVDGFAYTYETNGAGQEVLRDGFEKITLTYEADETGDEVVHKGPFDGEFYLYYKLGESGEKIYDSRVYVIDPRNQFYKGNRISYNYYSASNNYNNGAAVGRDLFVAQANRPENGRVVERNNSLGALVKYGVPNPISDNFAERPEEYYWQSTFYYDTYNDYYLIFEYDGRSCSGCSHRDYAYKQEITLDDIVCNTFAVEEGYHIAWYANADRNKPVTPFKITGPTRIYGRKEKNPIENKDYAFYKLPEFYEEVGAEWITLDNLSSFEWTDRSVYSGGELTVSTVDNTAEITGNGFETITKSIDLKYTNETGIETTYKGLRTEWYYNGLLVMARTPHYSTSFIEFTLDASIYASGGLYGVDGFTYDKTNVKNKSKAYVSTAPVNMYAYFTRDSYTLTVTRNNSKNSNDEVSTRVNGSLIVLSDPVKTGYNFNGWDLQKVTKDEAQNYVYTSLDKADYRYTTAEGKAKFLMPICDTRALALWETAEIDFSIVHMLQDNTHTFNTASYENIKGIKAGTISGTEKTVSIKRIGGEAESATGYFDEAGKIVGIEYVSDNFAYYYSGVSADSSDVYNVENSDIFAIIETLSGVKSEDEITVSDHEIDSLGDIFEYSFTNYNYDTEQLILSETTENEDGEVIPQTFTAYYDAEVTYYYSRSSSIVIRTLPLVTDSSSTDTGLTLSGAGNHYYGEETAIYATMQPNGYTFLGWFKASDVLKDYPAVGRPENLSGYGLIDNFDEAILSIEPVSTETTYVFVAKESEDYVAITSAGEAAKPTIKIKSARALTEEEATDDNPLNPYYYRYAADAKNTLTASVNWGALGAGANKIKNYTWYCKYVDSFEMTDEELAEFLSVDPNEIPLSEMEEIPNSNSGTYLFPTGKESGYYIYRCVVNVERADNGRTSTVYDTYLLQVHPSENYYEHFKTTVDYDGASHIYQGYFLYNSHTYVAPYYSKREIPVDITDEELAERLALSEDDDNRIYTECFGFENVNVDLTEGEHYREVIPNVEYFFMKSNDKNFANISGYEEVLINPVYLSVSAVKPFTKYYDASDKVLGEYNSKKIISGQEYDSDYHRLQTGSDIAGTYYRIDGVLECDKNLTLYVEFEGVFDSMHVNSVSYVEMRNMWIVQEDIDRIVNNYNYRFENGRTLRLSAQIKPYPLEVKWIPLEDSDPSLTYGAADYKYNYNGTEQHPYVYITDDNPPDPKEHFTIAIRNGQVNVGTYTATAEVVESENGGDYEPADYTFTLVSKQYSILTRYIKVAPKDITKVYNGLSQTMIKDAETDEFIFYTKEKSSDPWREYESLPDGETFTIGAAGSGKNAGTYTVAAQNLKIKNSLNKNINDNYVIEYGTGTLSIVPCPVIVEGIKANNKPYDGNTEATLDESLVSFARLSFDEEGNPVKTPGLYGSDSLSVNTSLIEGSFTNPNVGTGKTVNITYDDSSAAENGSGGILSGISRKNYRLVTEESQKTATADITSDTVLTVSLADVTKTYGETLSYSDYSLNYSGFMGSDTVSEVSDSPENHATFIIKKKNEDGTYTTVIEDGTSASIASLNVGTYYIFPAIKADGAENEPTGLASDNYTIIWDAQPAKLVVTKRKIAVAAVDAEPVTKAYDGTTSVEADIIKSVSEGVYSYYEFTAALGVSESGPMTGDEIYIDSYSAVYDSKDATGETEGAHFVKVTNIVIAGEKADNYQLVNTAFDVAGKITPIALTVQVENVKTVYGNAAPEFIYSVSGALLSEKSVIEAAVASDTTLHCDYENVSGSDNRHVGKYAITVDSEAKYSNPNYVITYKDGNDESDEYGFLTVEKRAVYYKASNVTIDYGKENPPSVFSGSFTADDTEIENDGWVYGENIATSGNTIPYNVSNVRIYEDEGLSSEITADYTVTYNCFETGTTPVTNGTPAGEYDITPSNIENTIYSRDYEFKKAEGTLTIVKYYIVIKNVEVLGKVYDGTTNVDADHILSLAGTYSGYDYPGLMFTYYEGAVSYVNVTTVSEDFLNSVEISAEYGSATVGEDKPVHVYISLKEGSYLDKRYVLLTEENLATAIAEGAIPAGTTEVTQTEAEAFILGLDGSKIHTPILRRPVTLYPSDKEILYGTNLTVTTDASKVGNYSIVKDVRPAEGLTGDDAAFGFAAGESFNNINFILSSSVYETTLDLLGRPDSLSGTAYSAGSDVGKYAINISGSTPSGAYKNYVVSYEMGLLTVVQNKFPAPTVTWDATVPGLINWTSVAKIGNVDTDHYEVSLYKDGVLVGTTYETADNTELSRNFLETMRAAGEGEYTVKVRAIASEDNNTVNEVAYANVAKEGAYGTSLSKKAARVYVVFDTTADSDTEKATTNAEATTNEINAAANYVMIAGESDIPVTYTWGRTGEDGVTVYRSGYAIDKIESSSEELTFGTATDNSVTGSYSTTVSLSGSLSETSDITVTLYLKARAADLTLSVTEDNGSEEVMYGYDDTVRPTYTANKSHSDSTEYEYTYSWYFKKGINTYNSDNLPSGTDESIVWDEEGFNFPLGQTVYSRKYQIYCTVRATRKDNGMYTEKTAFCELKIIKASLQQNSVEIKTKNWTYGDSRYEADGTTPKITYVPKLSGIGEITLMYKKSSDADIDANWSAKQPTDAGTYDVKAVVSANENYEGITINPVSYTIFKAALDVPENVAMVKSDTAPYGKVVWDATAGPKENAGMDGDSESHINVIYELTLSYIPKDSETSERTIITSVTTTDCFYDFTDRITNAGKYFVDISAKVDDREDETWTGQDKNNCADSDFTEIQALITIGANISANAEGFTKVYDGQPLTLTAEYSAASGEEPTYQWMKNGVEIPGATSNTYSITYVEESAAFSCKVLPMGAETEEGDIVYTMTVYASVTARPVTVTSSSATWTYDGETHVKNNVAGADKDYSVTLADGDSVTSVSLNSSIKTVGTKSNDITDFIITRNVGEADEKVVYQKDVSYNNYEVTYAPGILKVEQRDITITAKDGTWTYDGESHSKNEYTTSEDGLAGGDTVASVTISGSITHVGTNNNIPSAAVIKCGDDDVTANYNIHYANGTLTITGRNLEITAGSADKIYDGTPLTCIDFTVTGGTELATGDVLEVTNSGTITNVGWTANTVSTYVIKNAAGEVVTSDYAVTSVAGRLDVYKADDTIIISPQDKIYDSLVYADPSADVSGNGDITYKYYSESEGIYTELDSAPEDAGKWYVKAFIKDSENYNDAETDYELFEILKRAIEITADSASKVYDGTPIIKNSWKLTQGTIPEGETITSVTVTGSRTYYGTSENVPSAAVIKKGTKNTEKNYEVTYKNGTLSITRPQITIKADSASKTYDGVELKKSTYTIKSGTLADGDTVVSVDVSGGQLFYGTSDNVPSNAHIQNAYGEDVTESYEIAYENGTLSVGKREIIIRAADASKVYDGTALTKNEYSLSDDSEPLGAEDIFASVTVTGSRTDCGTSDNVASDAVIMHGDDDATGSYIISYRKGELKITQREIEITAASESRIFNGKPLTNAEAVITAGSLAADEEIISKTVTGTITHVGEADNTVTAVVIKHGDNDVTANYKITFKKGLLEITPHPINKLVLNGDEINDPVIIPFTGSLTGPAYVVTADGINDGTAILSETDDFTVTINEGSGKQKTAIYPGIYSIEVTGKGDYSGTLVKTYRIKDSSAPGISGGTTDKSIADDAIYCKVFPTVTIKDPTLTSVVISQTNAEGTSVFANDSFVPSEDKDALGNVVAEYTLPGSEEGTVYTITATDMDGNTTVVSNVLVYEDHYFVTYTPDAAHHLKTAPCEHNCGAIDTAVITHITANWHYAYSYSAADGVHSGVQGVAARATHAKVELKQNGTVIATRYIDCDEQCGVPALSPAEDGTSSITIEFYDPEDPLNESGTAVIPRSDEHGNHYSYSVEVTAMKEDGDNFNEAEDYSTQLTTGPTLVPGGYNGFIADISYSPGLFNVPWKVVLTGLPTANGTTIVPEALYVKVMYAYGPDADDSETDAGYQIISQQVGNSGTYCEVTEENGKYIYTGKYPVWEYQAGTTKSYYHRIQVVGYRYDDVDYDIESEKLKSINDKDHVNHTIYYVGDGKASGTILYEISTFPMMPVLMLDHNPGKDTTNIPVGTPDYYFPEAGTVTADKLVSAAPVRGDYYEFIGWYTEKKNGTLVTEVTEITEPQTIYAHWRELVAPNGTIKVGKLSYSDAADTTGKAKEVTTSTVVITAVDDGKIADVQTGVDNSGMKKISYYVSKTAVADPSADITNWTKANGKLNNGKMTAEFEITESGVYYIYAKLEDKDGNISYINTGKLKFTIEDNEQPEDPKPEDPKPEEPKPEDPKPEEPKPENPKPEEPKPENPKPEEPGTENPVPGDIQPNPDPVIVPVEPTQPDPNNDVPENTVEGPTDEGRGNIEVIVDNVDDSEPSKSDDETHIIGELPEPESVVDIVLADEEKEAGNDGEDIKIRLTIDDTNDREITPEIQKLLDELSDEGKTAELETHINLILEKKISLKDWENILKTKDEIKVTIRIPEGMIQDGKTIYVAKRDGSGYIILEDLDDDPNTITISTADFESDYILVSILDENVALANLMKECFWHWIILITWIIVVILQLLLKGRRNEDEEEDEKEEKNKNSGDEEEDEKKHRYVVRGIVLGAGDIVYIVCVILGFCKLDIPFAIVAAVTNALLEYYKQHKKDDEEEEDKKEQIM